MAVEAEVAVAEHIPDSLVGTFAASGVAAVVAAAAAAEGIPGSFHMEVWVAVGTVAAGAARRPGHQNYSIQAVGKEACHPFDLEMKQEPRDP